MILIDSFGWPFNVSYLCFFRCPDLEFVGKARGFHKTPSRFWCFCFLRGEGGMCWGNMKRWCEKILGNEPNHKKRLPIPPRAPTRQKKRNVSIPNSWGLSVETHFSKGNVVQSAGGVALQAVWCTWQRSRPLPSVKCRVQQLEDHRMDAADVRLLWRVRCLQCLVPSKSMSMEKDDRRSWKYLCI